MDEQPAISLSDGNQTSHAHSSEPSLYRPEFEHDACGTGFIAQLTGDPSHQIVRDALSMLSCMEHRGACAHDGKTGDGAGILLQIPDTFFREECKKLKINLPDFGSYGVGMTFFPGDLDQEKVCRKLMETYAAKFDLQLLGYRETPTFAEKADLGREALKHEPHICQLFIASTAGLTHEALERKLYVFRKAVSKAIRREVPEIGDHFYFTSLSYKTIVYKGQFRTHQVGPFFSDLQDERVVSSLAMIHSRFSTNTFPQWRLAQPFRYLAHNGEINTIKGNINWMQAKEHIMASNVFSKEELDYILPICNPHFSDSRNLDSIVELLVMCGRSLPHVMMMLIPEAWQHHEHMAPTRRAFYEYHSLLMEPWDGPASICFTDGKLIGATLDRNGLRPSRYAVTKDGRVIMASEAGALQLNPAEVVERGRLQPGKMFLIDLEAGKILKDEEVKQAIIQQKPYGEWLAQRKVQLQELSVLLNGHGPSADTLVARQQLFGITSEELKVVLAPMAANGKEPIGSMGSDTPLAVLSNQSQHISHYFKQQFAQVSNPPIDPIREKLVMSLKSWIGGSKNLLDETASHAHHIELNGPVLSNLDISRLKGIRHPHFNSQLLPIFFEPEESLEAALHRVCEAAERALQAGVNLLILSDKYLQEHQVPIPALLATGAVHHHLIRRRLRSETALIVETGDAREVHHFATLIGYGAVAVNPYLALESITHLSQRHPKLKEHSVSDLHQNYIDAIEKGLLKIFSKMGISTVQSYHGAQVFEVLGIHKEVVDKCFTGSISRIGGIGFDGIAREALTRYQVAYPEQAIPKKRLEVGGLYQWKQNGEAHLFNPETIHLLQYSTRRNDYGLYKKYAAKVNEQLEKAVTLRSLFEFTGKNPVPIEEVEPIEAIFKRFATGAMSFGSLSHEAHSTLAIAMNRIGGKSNSGEGGEDPIRFPKKPNGDWERSAIKQVASGRFGVTSYYLSEAEELQIKMAQGAKPGEGGQLPGHKVDEWIGRVRYSTPGVDLISPPPHHDIYSIEDLAQLIYDLKNANREARISVKLVSRAGVGTIAAGVAKAHADHILISGSDGGTGASPLSSIRHAGLPWELGLAEAHQTLVRNNLRSRVTLQVDGQIKTGRDMAIATLLGAEEWGVATAALVVEGCIMMRKCHLNTCPVGVATQDPELRKKFEGKAEHLVSFFHFLAQDFREHMAALGFRSVDEMVGQVDRLKVREELPHWKFTQLDLSPILYKQPGTRLFKSEDQDHGLEHVLDQHLIQQATESLEWQTPVILRHTIANTDRAVGTMLSHEISRRYAEQGLPEGTIHLQFSGSAGQSFAAFGAKGITFELQGEANDYLGKGLSGAQVVVYPDRASSYVAEDQVIVGNVVLYGATAGEVFIRGKAGERFAVRNSGATAVVEGVGDHGCEYMTGGKVVILGATGRNFAAGMSGGIAYVYDPQKVLLARCNTEMVDLDPMGLEDVQELRRLLSRHQELTDSPVAERLLRDWPLLSEVFVKVIPRAYKAVLAEQTPDSKVMPARFFYNFPQSEAYKPHG
ncbi:MAG: glutamate synthase large subunit [Bacteroidota bacterium]